MKLKFLTLILIILISIWILIICLVIFLPEKKYNSFYEMTKDFTIQKDGILEGEKVGLLYSNKELYSESDDGYCIFVDEFIIKNNYYIGHFDGSEIDNKKCKNYFYIKKDSTEVKFNISEEEIKKNLEI